MITKTGNSIIKAVSGKVGKSTGNPAIAAAILAGVGGLGSAISNGLDAHFMDDEAKNAIKEDKNLPNDVALIKRRAMLGFAGGALGALPGAYLAGKGLKNFNIGKMTLGAVGTSLGSHIGAGIANMHYGTPRAAYLLDPDYEE